MSHTWVQNFVTSVLIDASYTCYKYHHNPVHPSLPHSFPFPAGCHYNQRSNKAHDDTAFLWNFHSHSKLVTLSNLHALTENLFSHNLTTKKNKKTCLLNYLSYKSLFLKCFKNCVLIHNFILLSIVILLTK